MITWNDKTATYDLSYEDKNKKFSIIVHDITNLIQEIRLLRFFSSIPLKTL